MLSYYDEQCGVSLSRDNYLTWVISEGIVYWIVCIFSEYMRKWLYLYSVGRFWDHFIYKEAFNKSAHGIMIINISTEKEIEVVKFNDGFS